MYSSSIDYFHTSDVLLTDNRKTHLLIGIVTLARYPHRVIQCLLFFCVYMTWKPTDRRQLMKTTLNV